MAENNVETELLSQIKEVLLTFPKYWEEEVLLRNKVAEDLRSYNQELIEALLSNKLVKDTYSITLDSTNIFKIEEFISMLRYKNYWENSYTKYSNEIGLTSEGKYLNYNTDVVLDFPHKDSVLEGGMTKEDQGKEEVYYHNVLAKEEIDTLLSPKVLTNIKKYDKNGEHNIDDFTDQDNLIIKGNNLVALHSLKEKYTNKVKLIYIDPPYNTKSSATTFHYNNNFNHSTWLTFMKNRVETAKELLREDGVFVVAIDDNELFYLGVLLDEIFGEFNRLGVVSVVHNPGGRQDEEHFPTAHENMIIYAKERDRVQLNYLPLSKEKIKQFNKKDSYGLYKTRNFRRSGNNSLRVERPKLFYPIYFNADTGEISLTKKSSMIEILPIDPSGVERCWRWGKETFLERKERYIEVIERNDKYDLYVKERESDYQGEKPKTIWNKSEYTGQTATHGLKSLFNDNKVFSYPKSEFLIKDILHVCTNKNDLVLDFFMGSATTQAVAHKMNRQYIGIEQMDYINTVSVPRLQKVIEGEQGGISEDVDWKGGGSFVYAELTSLNDEYIKNIQASNSEEELEKVLFTMKESAYFNFKVDLERVSSKDEGYHALSLEEKKEVLIQVLDMNQLYLSYSEIEDEQYKIPEDVKAFNHSFYQKEGVQDE